MAGDDPWADFVKTPAKQPAKKDPWSDFVQQPAKQTPAQAAAPTTPQTTATPKETWPQYAGKMAHEAALGVPFAANIAAGAQAAEEWLSGGPVQLASRFGRRSR